MLNVLAYPSSLESSVHNVGGRVHSVLYDLFGVWQRHSSAVGQSVQRSNELGAQNKQKKEQAGRGHRGHRSMNGDPRRHTHCHPTLNNPIYPNTLPKIAIQPPMSH